MWALHWQCQRQTHRVFNSVKNGPKSMTWKCLVQQDYMIPVQTAAETAGQLKPQNVNKFTLVDHCRSFVQISYRPSTHATFVACSCTSNPRPYPFCFFLKKSRLNKLSSGVTPAATWKSVMLIITLLASRCEFTVTWTIIHIQQCDI
jgi:hypothetical protein